MEPLSLQPPLAQTCSEGSSKKDSDCFKSLLDAAGFKKASLKLVETKARAGKLNIAYQHYQWIRKETVEQFNKNLRAKTTQKGGPTDRFYETVDTLAFVKVEEYEKIPPALVLTKLIEARNRGCFDSYEVAFIQSVEVQKDPIVFGRIKGCTDRFFIAQWDDDVKFEDLVKLEQ